MEDVFLGIALFFVIVVTGLLSFIQETRRSSMAREFEKTSPQVARVIREGEELEVPSEEIVMGDIVLIRVGERVPADCRILEVVQILIYLSGKRRRKVIFAMLTLFFKQ